MPYQLTLLTEPNAIMTKTFTPEGVKAYDSGHSFYCSHVDVSDIFELSAALTTIEDLTSTIVIRGEVLSDVDLDQPVLRRKDAYDGHRAYFRSNPAGVPWVMLDFDKLPAPANLTMEERLEYLISHLPEYLHDVTYYYQWSSSAGVKGWDSLSCHIWMWLEEPRTDEQMGWWAQQYDIDDAVMRTVQVHYTANPIFLNVDDPLGDARSGLVLKPRNAANIPIVKEPEPIRPPRVPRDPAGGITWQSHAFDDYLKHIGNRLHMPIQRAICAWLASTNANSDTERLKDRLRDVIQASGRGDITLYMSDRYLNQCIRSAKRKVSPDPHGPRTVPETDMERLRAKITRKYKGTHND